MYFTAYSMLALVSQYKTQKMSLIKYTAIFKK